MFTPRVFHARDSQERRPPLQRACDTASPPLLATDRTQVLPARQPNAIRRRPRALEAGMVRLLAAPAMMAAAFVRVRLTRSRSPARTCRDVTDRAEGQAERNIPGKPRRFLYVSHMEAPTSAFQAGAFDLESGSKRSGTFTVRRPTNHRHTGSQDHECDVLASRRTDTMFGVFRRVQCLL
jgi:hypothetical protein